MEWIAFLTFSSITIIFGLVSSFYLSVSKKDYVTNKPNEIKFVQLAYRYRDAIRERDPDSRIAKIESFEDDLLETIAAHEEKGLEQNADILDLNVYRNTAASQKKAI